MSFVASTWRCWLRAEVGSWCCCRWLSVWLPSATFALLSSDGSWASPSSPSGSSSPATRSCRSRVALVASVVAGSLVTGLLLGLEYKAHIAAGRLTSNSSGPTGNRTSTANER